ncbi:MAG: HD domain-containing protein [Clostridia bacterium]|nr:HD domain-containing protein [Clostridia bacterium]
MHFYLSSIILIELLMLSMTIHVIRYSGFDKQQKTWHIITFVSVMFCAAAEYAVHCGYYSPSFAVPLTIITVLQFSVAPPMAVFFSGALGLHEQSKKALWFFIPHAAIEIIAAPFGWIFYFAEDGYHRGNFFMIYSVFYFFSLIYLMVCMLAVGKRFKHRDKFTIIMVVLTLIAGIIPVTFMNLHTAYISIGMAACLCYIYYNDLVQEDTQVALIANQKRITDMQEHMISGLASVIENRDTDTGQHVSRTREYVKLIALGALKEGVYTDEIDGLFINLIYTLAPMHDVGKIVVSDTILKKPAKLTAEEFEQMKLHAAKGGVIVGQILSGITDESYLRFASDIAMYHHERWDGTGYPEGLKAKDIPLCARIMALADVYDALISDRCYKKALPENEALEIIKEESGTHFDPQLITVFLKYVQTNSGL